MGPDFIIGTLPTAVRKNVFYAAGMAATGCHARCIKNVRGGEESGTRRVTLIVFMYILTLSSGGFSFALDARLFVVCSTASFSQNAVLLNFSTEPFESALKRFVFADFDF